MRDFPSLMCALDTDNIMALAACVTAFIALVAAIISIWQAHFTTRVQALLQCDSSWTSDSMRATRRKAAASLLKGQPTADVDRILDFFETIAGLFVKRHGLFCSRVLPDKWARHTFYWHAACYWSKSRDYIDTVRQRPTEQAAWEDLCELMPRWIAAEGGSPTPKDIDDFLADERSV
jgi:hypothetical protein